MGNPEQQTRLKATFNLFLNSDPENSLHFIVRFLVDNPQLKELYPQLRSAKTIEDLKRDKWLCDIYLPSVISSIGYIVQNCNDISAVCTEAVRILNLPQHIDNKIYKDHYALMFQSLLETIKESCIACGYDFTDDDRQIWLNFASCIYTELTNIIDGDNAKRNCDENCNFSSCSNETPKAPEKF